MEIRLRADKKRLLTLKPVRKDGSAATLDGVPVWTSGDPTAVEVVASADGLSAYVVGKDVVGATVLVTAEGDADLGSGVRALKFEATVSTVAPEAVELGIEVGEEEDR